MNQTVDLLIIGAGTAGLSAYKEASKYTENIVIVDQGPIGSTCARVGCMPSKTFIQVANDYHNRHYFSRQGIENGMNLQVEIPAVLAYVRKMRDQFTSGVVEYTQSLGQQFICGQARFLKPDLVQVGDQTISAKSVIIASGTQSIIPKPWEVFEQKILTSETIFEQKNLQKKIGVIGAGVIGLELGQALSRLGISIFLYHAGQFIGGLTDPKVNEVAIRIFNDEFPLHIGQEAKVFEQDNQLLIQAKQAHPVDQILAAIGRRSNLDNLGVSELGLELDQSGVPIFNRETMQVGDSSIFIAGDTNQFRPLLHEAADEGRIAAYNAIREETRCFQRRTPMRIVFTEPNIAVIGTTFRELNKDSSVIGSVDYSEQGRAKVMHQNQGILRIYGDQKTGTLLGAEMIAPGAEHLAHLLAWAIYKKMTVFDVLQMPFYHPVIEEGMRTALRDLAKQVQDKTPSFELAMCDSEAIHCTS